MDRRLVTVFGGTGFLGRRVVRHLRERAVPVRVASRHSERARQLFGAGDAQLESVAADVHDAGSVAQAVSGARAVVNALSLYVEHGGATFVSVHVEGAARLAASARESGVERLVHVSGIGADPEFGFVLHPRPRRG